MIIPSQILSHIQKYISRFTDMFDVSLTVSVESIVDARTIRIATVEDHGLPLGKFIISPTGLNQNAITAVEAIGDNLEFTTQYTHDLTNTDMDLDDTNLLLAGFTDSAYNASFNIQAITAQNKFQIINPEITTPTLNSSELLLEDRPLGVKGIFEVTNIIGLKTFEMTIPDIYPDLPLTGVQDLSIIKGLRIAATATIERADAQYTKQVETNPWMFLVMGDVDTSKDRHTLSDAELDASIQDSARQKFLQHFSLVVYIPTDKEIAGVNAQEVAYGELFTALLSVLFGALFTNSDDRINLLTVSKGHGPGIYNTAYYTHVYEWQVPTDITFDVGIQGKIFEDVAFRKLEGDLKPFDPDNPDGFEFTIDLL